MPEQTKTAVEWALQQIWKDELGVEHSISYNDDHHLVDKVREYFNVNKISYEMFSYENLKPFLT